MKKCWKNYLLLSGLICLIGIYLIQQNDFLKLQGKIYLFQQIQDVSENLYFPGIKYIEERKNTPTLQEQIADRVMAMIPLGKYVSVQKREEIDAEDEETYSLLLKKQEEDENTVDERGCLVGTDQSQETLQEVVNQENLSAERLSDQAFLVSKFYTVDSVTYLEDGDLDAKKMLEMDMKIDETTNGPKILIFHTHSQESFSDSDGSLDESIVGVGRYLTELLNNKYKIETLHHEGVYDLIGGKLDRSEAYEKARPNIQAILEKNPSIEVVIDLHRDGVKETTHLVSEINGKPTAQIMFFNGMCRTRSNGDLSAMLNPYIDQNLAFSMQMKIAAEKYFPGFTRRNYLKGYKYNMDLAPKMLLIEAGAQTNSLEEMQNAMEPLAALLNQVLTK